jgi:hypothetical protein
MTLRDDLLKLNELNYWEHEEFERTKNEIDSLITRTKPGNTDHKDLVKINKDLVKIKDHIKEKDFQKANEMINDLKREAESIDELTSDTHESHDDVAAIVQMPIPPNKKTGFLKKAVAYGLTLFTLGMYAPAVNAENSAVGTDGKTATIITRPVGGMSYVGGQGGIIATSGDGLVGTSNGKLITIIKPELGEGATKIMQ